VPKRKQKQGTQLTNADINAFLQSFSCEQQTDVQAGKHTFKGASTGGANNVGTQAFKKAKKIFGNY